MHNLNDGDEWMLAEDIPECDLFFSQIWLNSFVNNLENSCGRNYSKVLAVCRGLSMKFYFGREDCRQMTLHLLNRIIENPSFGEEINTNIMAHSDALVEFTEKWCNEDLSKKTSEELIQILLEHIRVHTLLYEWGWLSNATDMFYPEYTNYLKNYLREKEKDEEKVNKHFVSLTEPNEFSKAALEQLDFLRVAIEIENLPEQRDLFSLDIDSARQRIKPSLHLLIEKHWRNYKHIPALWCKFQPPAEYYYAHLKEFFDSGKSAAEEFEKMRSELESKKQARAELLEKLRIDSLHKRLFGVYADFMLTKLYRRYAQILAIQRMDSVLEEIGRRLNLSRIEVRNTLASDLVEMLRTKKVDYALSKQRSEYNVFYAEKGVCKQFTGEEARKLEEDAEKIKVDPKLREVHGQVACLGFAKGVAKIIHSLGDAAKFSEGDVLIAIATNPDVVPLMKKAAAIVTEQGGVTSHAAIVSRELGIPCVIGTKIVTKWLKDGDLVEVDASRGVVKKL